MDNRYEELIIAGEREFSLGNIQRSFDFLLAAARLDPTNPVAYSRLIHAFESMGMHDQAVRLQRTLDDLNKTYLVTAIVSVYKAERYMRHRIENLLQQTLGSQLEIIVIDACSPENEGAIVAEYLPHHPNLIYIRTPEREKLYASWNRAAKMARGKYITNANADDVLRFDALERLALALDDNPDCDLAYANFWITNRENQNFADHIRCGYATRPAYDPTIMLYCCYMGPQPMWRKSIHDKIGYFDERYTAAGDYEFWLRIAAAGMKMKYVNEFLGVYYHNPKGICNANTKITEDETRAIVQAYWNQLPPPVVQSPVMALNGSFDLTTTQHASICLIARSSAEQIALTIRTLWLWTIFPYRISVADPGGNAVRSAMLRKLHQEGQIHYLHACTNPTDLDESQRLLWTSDPSADFVALIPDHWQVKSYTWLDITAKITEGVPRLALLGVQGGSVEALGPLQEQNLGQRMLLCNRRTLQGLGLLEQACHFHAVFHLAHPSGGVCVDAMLPDLFQPEATSS